MQRLSIQRYQGLLCNLTDRKALILMVITTVSPPQVMVTVSFGAPH